MANPYTTPVIVRMERLQTQDPNFGGGEDPEIVEHRFDDLQLAYHWCLKEARLQDQDVQGEQIIDVHGWEVIPFARLKQILVQNPNDSVEAFYAESEDGDYVSFELHYDL